MSEARSGLTFFDTNILFYSDDGRSAAKQKLALKLILAHRENGTGVVSLQVLQEYFVSVTRKLGLDPAIARHKVEIFSRFHVVEPVLSDVLAAVDVPAPSSALICALCASACAASSWPAAVVPSLSAPEAVGSAEAGE